VTCSRSTGAYPATAILAVAIVVIGTGMAEAQIAGGDRPGRERYRFVDPPGQQLLQPRGPNTVLPYGARGPQFGCPPRKAHRKQRARKHC